MPNTDPLVWQLSKTEWDDHRREVRRILTVVAGEPGGTIGLEEKQRDTDRRLDTLERVRQTHRVWWKDISFGFIGAAIMVLATSIEAIIKRAMH